MKTHYQLMPGADLKKDESAILETLSAVMEDRIANDLKLLNYFREVPINFGAAIDQIDRGMVEMTVHQLQAVLMREQKETFLRSSHFEHDVIARVMRADSDRNFAFLSHFSYVEIFADRRAHVRVEVSENIAAIFSAGELRLQGMIRDISIGGMAFTTQEQQGFEENIKGKIGFSLRGNKLEFPAILMRMEDDTPEKRFIVRYTPDNKSEEIISHFVFQTQSEIIRELKEKISC